MILMTCLRRTAAKAIAIVGGGAFGGVSKGICALVAVAALLTGFSNLSPARADGALEEAPGGLLHRYRKSGDARLDSERRRPIRRVPRVRRTNLGGVAENGEEVRSRRRRIRRARTQHRRKARHSRRRIRVASLGGSFSPRIDRGRRRGITGGSGRVQWVASAGCLNRRLRAVVYHVARNYGRVRVNSTCRSRRHNRRVGGARRSHHLNGNAVDFRVFGNVRGAARYLRSAAGGYKHYGGGLFHVDTGPRRSW
ncbi:MAG: DUF882 domain-containing protein [Hyphomicrobiaceae bacterium]|nr:DUF882 domain-containing protein [Hyphomicrobiaceae bacterium]